MIQAISQPDKFDYMLKIVKQPRHPENLLASNLIFLFIHDKSIVSYVAYKNVMVMNILLEIQVNS